MVKVYYLPFDGGSALYDSAYEWFSSRSSRFEIVRVRKSLLLLPYRATLVIEAISSIGWELFLRPDIYILHFPRGGASLKIGWRSTGALNWHVGLRLSRRNRVLFRNDAVGRYYSLEENTPSRKLVLGPEVLDDFLLSTRSKNDGAHVSLSECWSLSEIDEFLNFLRELDTFKGRKISVSFHPSLTVEAVNVKSLGIEICEFGEHGLPAIFVTDCVSTVYLAAKLGIKIWIVKSQQTSNRELFIPQQNLFKIPDWEEGVRVIQVSESTILENPMLKTSMGTFESALQSAISR